MAWVDAIREVRVAEQTYELKLTRGYRMLIHPHYEPSLWQYLGSSPGSERTFTPRAANGSSELIAEMSSFRRLRS